MLSDFDGRIFVASIKEIYSLVPVAWEKQVRALFKSVSRWGGAK